MKITICIGSSCHLKGSREVVEQLQQLTEASGLQDCVELAGSFCMGRCQTGVSVDVDGTYYSVSPDTAAAFFRDVIAGPLKDTGSRAD